MLLSKYHNIINMTTILLLIQIFIVLALIGVILLQKTGSDSLAGLSGSGHNVFSNRSASNIFNKTTIVLAAAFMINSLIIAKVIKSEYLASNKSILDTIVIPGTGDKKHAPEKSGAPKMEE